MYGLGPSKRKVRWFESRYGPNCVSEVLDAIRKQTEKRVPVLSRQHKAIGPFI
jgi:hypothetical protein